MAAFITLYIGVFLSLLRAAEGPHRPKLTEPEKVSIVSLLNSNDEWKGRKSLVKMGERILPVLLDVVKSPESDDWLRARVFFTVRDMPNINKDDFVALAVANLPKSSLYGNAALSLIENSKSSKYADLVCDYLFALAKEDDKEQTNYSKPATKAILAIGTRKELDRIETWLKDHKPLEGEDDRIWKVLNTTASKLRSRLQS